MLPHAWCPVGSKLRAEIRGGALALLGSPGSLGKDSDFSGLFSSPWVRLLDIGTLPGTLSLKAALLCYPALSLQGDS